MAIINRLPKGFLSFLDQQTQGKNPQEPAEGLRLTSDLDAFYRSQEVRGNSVVAAMDTTNQTTAITSSVALTVVPEGFVWEILAIEARINPNGNLAGTLFLTNSIAIVIPQTATAGLNIKLASGRVTMGAVPGSSASTSVVWQPPQRLILPPGIPILAQVTEYFAPFAHAGMTNSLAVARYAWQI